MSYILIDDLPTFRDMVVGYCSRPHHVAFDTETTGLSFLDHRLISLQFMQFGYIPVIVDVRKWTSDNFREAGEHLQRLFDNCVIVGMNLSFDFKFVAWHCGAWLYRLYDVMLADQVVHGLGQTGGREKGIEFNLKAIAARYRLDVSKEERSVFIDMDKTQAWHQPLPESTLQYMAQDVQVLQPIYEKQVSRLREKRLTWVSRIENQALPALAYIEYCGIHISEQDWRDFITEKAEEARRHEERAIEIIAEAVSIARARRFKKLMKAYNEWKAAKEAKEAQVKAAFEASTKQDGWGQYKKRAMSSWRACHPNPGLPKLETHEPPESWDGELAELAEARQLCFAPINLNSPRQMLEAFEVLKIPVTSTSKDALADLPEGEYEVVDELVAWRKANVFPTKFGTLLTAIHPKTGRIHPTYIAIGADTGRSSCTNPPWQQIPAKGDGARLRSFVRAEPGNVLLTADFSNIELRILADYSGDKNMLEAFASGRDLHSYTARMMFGLPEEWSDKEVKAMKSPQGYKYRDVAKTINFGLVYGMSANKLARTLKISKENAQELMEKYFSLYPGVVKWLESQRKDSVFRLESRTMCGRVRYYELPRETNSKEYKAQLAAVERKACNSPIQGTSADITKIALAKIYQKLFKFGLLAKIKIVAVVHDEIVLEAPEDLTKIAQEILASSMDEACSDVLKSVAVPPTVVSIGVAWEKA
jgi:DNA polymerase-1